MKVERAARWYYMLHPLLRIWDETSLGPQIVERKFGNKTSRKYQRL